MNDNIFLTEEGKQKLQDELGKLKGPQREALAKRLKSAIEMGDLSENADYKTAKEEQGFLEGRIQEIEQILNYAVIISKTDQKSGKVVIGSKVTIQEGQYPQEIFEIVGLKESNPREGKISYVSPMGKALMGKKSGEDTIMELPGKIKTKIKVIKVN